MFQEPVRSNVAQIITTKGFQSILLVVMMGLAVLWTVDCVFLIRGLLTESVLEVAYLITTVSISYMQLLFYYLRYDRRTKHVK